MLCLFFLCSQVAKISKIAGLTVELTYFWCICWVKTLLPSTLQQSHHVFGEQKQPGDGDISDVSPRSSGQEQPEVTRGRCRELWGASSAAGHLREQRHPEAAAVCSPARRAVRHPHWGLRPRPTGGWVWLLNVFLLSLGGLLTSQLEMSVGVLLIIYKTSPETS